MFHAFAAPRSTGAPSYFRQCAGQQTSMQKDSRAENCCEGNAELIPVCARCRRETRCRARKREPNVRFLMSNLMSTKRFRSTISALSFASETHGRTPGHARILACNKSSIGENLGLPTSRLPWRLITIPIQMNVVARDLQMTKK